MNTKNQTAPIFTKSSVVSPETARKINEFVRKGTAAGKWSRPLILDSKTCPPTRSPEEIAVAILERSKGSFAKGVQGLPNARFRLPVIETTAAGLELLACAAAHEGWSLDKFILDAAICRAQEVRDECRRNKVSFSDLPHTVSDNPMLALTLLDPSPELRMTCGKRGVPPVAAVNDNNEKE